MFVIYLLDEKLNKRFLVVQYFIWHHEKVLFIRQNVRQNEIGIATAKIVFVRRRYCLMRARIFHGILLPCTRITLSITVCLSSIESIYSILLSYTKKILRTVQGTFCIIYVLAFP